MHVQVFSPRHPALRPLIHCFYLLQRGADAPTTTYLTFPTTMAALFVSNQSQVEIGVDTVSLRPAPRPQLTSFLATNFDQPKLISYQGPAWEINVYFKPLGLNAFLPRDLIEYVPEAFSPFFPFPTYEAEIKALLDLTDEASLFEALEQYWLKQLRGFQHPYLPELLTALNQEETHRLSDLSFQFGISLKTLNAQFKRHLTRSPSRYRRVLRFRRLLAAWDPADKGRLTDLSYAYAFFDQSHMVREFKALTGLSPKAFFQDLYRQTSGGIFWKFMEG